MEEFLVLAKIADEAELYEDMKEFLHQALANYKKE
jgi:hypothetical protein